MSTIFKKIIDREIPARIVYEDDHCLAFHDIAPKSPVHILVIPKKEISGVGAIEEEDELLMGHCLYVIRRLAEEQGVAEDGYRVVINHGKNAEQSVEHLHFHLMGGRSFTWPPG